MGALTPKPQVDKQRSIVRQSLSDLEKSMLDSLADVVGKAKALELIMREATGFARKEKGDVPRDV